MFLVGWDGGEDLGIIIRKITICPGLPGTVLVYAIVLVNIFF